MSLQEGQRNRLHAFGYKIIIISSIIIISLGNWWKW